MVKSKTFMVCSVFFLVTGTALAGSKELKARADIIDPDGKTVGTATLTEQKDGVRIVLKVSGLTPGKHGFHIHENGACTPPDFKSAGGHFNPFHKQHGIDNPQGKHAGDLPNLEVGKDGAAEVTVVAKGTTLGKGAGSLLNEGGTSIVKCDGDVRTAVRRDFMDASLWLKNESPAWRHGMPCRPRHRSR